MMHRLNRDQRFIAHLTLMLLGLMIVMWFGWHMADIYAWVTPDVDRGSCPPDIDPCYGSLDGGFRGQMGTVFFIFLPMGAGLGLAAISFAALVGKGPWSVGGSPAPGGE